MASVRTARRADSYGRQRSYGHNRATLVRQRERSVRDLGRSPRGQCD